MLMLSNAVTVYSRHPVNACGRKRGEIENFYSFIQKYLLKTYSGPGSLLVPRQQR